MPNHITNHITIESNSIQELDEFVKKYSTKHPAKAGRSMNNELRFVKEGTKNSYGFLDLSTGEFKVRNFDKDVDRTWDTLQEVPEEYDVDITEAWLHFPDFNKIIPMPEHSDTFFAEGGLGDKERQKYGQNNWYDWSVENWGTKWNSYDCSLLHPTRWFPERRKYVVTYRFDTAWAGVPQLIEKMAEQNPELNIRYAFASEDMGYNAGEFEYEDGNLVSVNHPEGGSTEAMELYFETHPNSREHYIYEDGKWNHKEDLGWEYDYETDTYIHPDEIEK